MAKEPQLGADILVIGGGAVGLGCARTLAGRGFRATLVERGACGSEASWAGGGIISMLPPWAYSDPVSRLALRGGRQFQDWVAELHEETALDTEYCVSGMRVLKPADLAFARDWCGQYGVRFEEDAGDLWLPEVAQVRNPRLLHALRASVEKRGGSIVERCEVRRIVVTGNQVDRVETSCGEFRADRYLVTAGAWSKVVLGEHALQLDIRPVKGQMLLYRFSSPPLETIVLEKDLYLIPRRDGHLLVGSTLEDSGFDKSTTEHARIDLARRAGMILPQLNDMAPVRHWAGLRPGSPGNIPTIGRHPVLENLYLCSGHFRYGVTMAPASAELLANELEGLPQPLDMAPYRAGWSAPGGASILG